MYSNVWLGVIRTPMCVIKTILTKKTNIKNKLVTNTKNKYYITLG